MAIVKMTTREPRGLQRGNRHTTRKHPGEPGHPRKLWCHYFFAVDNMCAVCVYVPSRGASPLDPSSPHQPKAADPNLVDAELGGGGGGRRLL